MPLTGATLYRLRAALGLWLCLALHAPAAEIGGQVELAPGVPRTRLDRSTGRLTSRVPVMIGNPSGASFLPPLHLTVGMATGRADRIEVPNALGGPTQPPYGAYYYDLAPRTANGVLTSGDYIGQEFVFSRHRYERFRYEAAPHGEPRAERPPVLALDPLIYTVAVGAPLAFDMTATDPDGQVVVLTSEPVLAHAALTATGGVTAAGTFAFTPDDTQRGTHVVTFTARDVTGLTDVKAVEILVQADNRPPTVSAPAAAQVAEGRQITIPVTGDDPDGDPITIDVGPLPDNAVFIQTAGGITFAPDYDQAGVYTMTCIADDGALQSAPSVIEVTVTDVTTGGGTNALVLRVDPAESPTLLARQRITGTVNADPGLPPPRAITSAVISGLDPSGARQGAADLDVVLTGRGAGAFATHFSSGLSTAGFGPGIQVHALTVNSPSQAVARISVDAEAAPGPRGVRVVTGAETALAIPAFNVTAGRAAVQGRIVDPETGLGVANARVTVEGTAVTVVTGADGTFVLPDVPAGELILIVNPPNHRVLRLPVTAAVGVPVDLGNLGTPATVYDPTTAVGVSVHSLLQRGLAELGGRMSIAEAREVVRDTMILVGGDEAGVLDEYGNQLNPDVDGAGLVSLTDGGVDLFAEHMAQARNTRLISLFYDLSFALKWAGGAPPPFTEWLAAAQALVNEAWADPGDPNHRVVIAVFAPGRQMPPDPPVLSGATRINRFQAFLLVSGCMAAAYNHQGDWFNVAYLVEPPLYESLGTAVARVFGDLFAGAAAYAQAADDDGIYTFAWDKLFELTGVTPTEPDFATGTSKEEHVPAFEDLMRKYYVSGSPDALTGASNLLVETFHDVSFIEDIFDRDPFAASEVMSNLVELSRHDVAVRDELQTLCDPNSGQLNMWNAVGVTKGRTTAPFMVAYVAPELVPSLLLKSLAPSAPFIYTAREDITLLQGATESIRVPTLEIEFRASNTDPDPLAEVNGQRFAYRLWRVVQDTNTVSDLHASRLVQVAGGVATTNAYDSHLQPRADTTNTRKLTFIVPFPPAGLNQYRIDCLRSETAIIDALTASNDWANANLRPWLDGYLDDPLAVPQGWFDGAGRRFIHPGQTWIRGVQVDYSALSNPKEVYVGGAGMGLAAFSRVDLAADYATSERLYISIPGFKSEANNRGSGILLRYDPRSGGLSEVVTNAMLFMEPGQVGAALDEDGAFYTVNGASMTAYGGKIFKYTIGADGVATEREWLGSVNYYSTLLNRSHPTAVQQIILGLKEAGKSAPPLFLADTLDNKIKKFDTGASANLTTNAPWNALYHIVSNEILLENDAAWAHPNRLAFGPRTDLAFSRDHSRLFISQGAYVLQYDGHHLVSITGDETFFTAAAGLSVCGSREGDFLFVADSGEDRILRIPLADIPMDLPADPAVKADRIATYTFLEGLSNPGALRITDQGEAMAYTDGNGMTYLRFGFTGRALDLDDRPMVGAAVTFTTSGGQQTTVTDQDGWYAFSGFSSEPEGILEVSKGSDSYTEKINVCWQCSSSTRPTPCVLITEPAGGTVTSNGQVTVRGTVLPASFDFTQLPALLEVGTAAGQATYSVVYTGNDNDFVVENVDLAGGDNVLVARVGATGAYQPGQSIPLSVARSAAVPPIQSVAGLAVDDAGNPMAGATVRIFVDGSVVDEVVSDGCGYYTASGLPLGTVTAEVVL